MIPSSSELVFVAFQVLVILTSLFLAYQINTYISYKMLGLQTSIDLTIKDSIKVHCLFVLTIFLIDILLVFIPGQVNETFALILYALMVFEVEIISVGKIVHHWHRYLLIFHQDILDGFSDKAIHNFGRLSIITVFLLCLGLDVWTSKAGMKCGTLGLMTKVRSTKNNRFESLFKHLIIH